MSGLTLLWIIIAVYLALFIVAVAYYEFCENFFCYTIGFLAPFMCIAIMAAVPLSVERHKERKFEKYYLPYLYQDNLSITNVEHINKSAVYFLKVGNIRNALAICISDKAGDAEIIRGNGIIEGVSINMINDSHYSVDDYLEFGIKGEHGEFHMTDEFKALVLSKFKQQLLK